VNAMSRQRVVIRDDEIARMCARLAHEIVEPAEAREGVILLGVRRGGEGFAGRLAAEISRIGGAAPELGFLNLDLYRDDRVSHEMAESRIPVDVTGRTVVVVDDVLYTGRTIRAALDAVTDLGRPSVVRLCVLVDRGLRELPIQPDYVGRVIPTSPGERVAVSLGAHPSPSDEVLVVADTP
jgi:pyrimidine operon attenuation protein / uracil phosphoribosyltransferase